jgi:hypothetical protein
VSNSGAIDYSNDSLLLACTIFNYIVSKQAHSFKQFPTETEIDKQGLLVDLSQLDLLLCLMFLLSVFPSSFVLCFGTSSLWDLRVGTFVWGPSPYSSK